MKICKDAPKARYTKNIHNCVPEGLYCYTRIGGLTPEGLLPIKRCPFWMYMGVKYDEEISGGLPMYKCNLIGQEDFICLHDQVKICGIKD